MRAWHPPESLAAELSQHAQLLQLRTARLTTMLSVVYNGDTSQLANVRAVSADYPLRGTLTVAMHAVWRGRRHARDSGTPVIAGPTRDWRRRWASAWAARSPWARARCA